MLDDAETRREVQTTNPMVEFRRWVAMEGDEVAGSFRAAFRRPGTPDEKDYARFLLAGGGVRASSRRRGVGTLLLREVHQLMHALDKTVLTISAQTEPGHAFIKHVGAIEKHSTVEQRAIFADLDCPPPPAVGGRSRCSRTGLGAPRGSRATRCTRGFATRLHRIVRRCTLALARRAGDRPIRWKMNGYDLWYETLERVGGAHHLVLLRAPDGSVAGLSEAGWDSRTPALCASS
jgi:GNAT superfamily N-acetyltransferase